MIDIVLFSILGLMIGSFLNVIIIRIPKDESIVFGASHCVFCKKTLKLWHNIPLLSWIFLRGKCSYCKTDISIRYPLVELASLLIFLITILKIGLSFETFMIALSFSMLLVLSMIDFKYKMVPDSINILAIIFAIFGAYSILDFMDNFKNAMILAGAFTLLRFLMSYLLTSSTKIQREKTQTSWSVNYHTYPFVEAMGEGDIMVFASMGALLGIELSLIAVFLSSLLALPVLLYLRNRLKEEQRVAFIPFLFISALVVFIFDTQILEYIRLNY